jgi:hypothetical protein
VFAAKGTYIGIYKKQNEEREILVSPVTTGHTEEAHIQTPGGIGTRNVT